MWWKVIFCLAFVNVCVSNVLISLFIFFVYWIQQSLCNMFNCGYILFIIFVIMIWNGRSIIYIRLFVLLVILILWVWKWSLSLLPLISWDAAVGWVDTWDDGAEPIIVSSSSILLDKSSVVGDDTIPLAFTWMNKMEDNK